MKKTNKNDGAIITKRAIDNMPTMGQVCLTKLSQLKEVRAKLTAEKEALKVAKSDLKQVNESLKSINGDIRLMANLNDLASQKPLDGTKALFKNTMPAYEVGRFVDFNLQLALDLLPDLDVALYEKEIDVIEDNLNIIMAVIFKIQDSNLYQDIAMDLLPQYVSNANELKFSNVKKVLNRFAENNLDVLADNKVTFDAPSSKVIGLNVQVKIAIGEKSQNFVIDMVKFGRFATSLQKVIAARVAKTELKIFEKAE